MHDLFAVGGLLSAFGLASAAGLNGTLPLLTVGLLSHFGHLTVAADQRWLSSWPALIVLAVVFVVDVVGDKIPGVDHVLHLVGVVAYPAAGALAFASQAGVVRHLPTPLSFVLGLSTAGSIHLLRAGVRPVATATTAGLANPVVSTVEDLTSGLLTFLALALPFLVLGALMVLGWLSWRVARRFGRGVRRRVRPVNAPTPPSPSA